MSNVLPLIKPVEIDFRKYAAANEHRAKVIAAENWSDALAQELDSPEQITGAKLPWSQTFDNVRFRPGEVTVWAGENGSGKSQLLGMAVLGFAQQGESSCIASFEMKPLATLKRQVRQASCSEQPTGAYGRKFLNWIAGKQWIYDYQGQITPEKLFGVMRYCAEVHQIRHFVIDSLMKCVRGEDDHNGQKDFVDMLTVLARDLDMHVHLVHHMRKGEDDSQNKPRGKNAIKGSGSITDQVDQVAIVWRNRGKERDVKSQMFETGVVKPETLAMPDAYLLIEKNRHGEWEGRIPLWYHAGSLQYVARADARPLNLCNSLNNPTPPLIQDDHGTV